ncbi:MAG: hypothetical protein PHP63_07285 [Candidatus Marinimicrobia bacterium]|nr:hypothetical protein [Candidatus Neomarinimicrobiota bacterium]
MKMTRRQRKVVMAAVAIIKRYAGENYDAMETLEDFLREIESEEIFDIDSLDPIADLKEKIAERFGEEKVSIADVIFVAANDCNYPQNLIAAIFELNPGDIRRFNATGFTPHYVLNAFSRYFNLKENTEND